MLCVSPQTSPAFMPWQQETYPVDWRRNPSLEIILFFRPLNPSHPYSRLWSCAPLFSHGLQSHFTVSPFIPDCTGNSTARLQSASNRLSLPPPSDIQVWTDGSVPYLFGPGGAGVYVTCSKCNTSYFLSFSTGPIASRLHNWNLCPQARSRLVY